MTLYFRPLQAELTHDTQLLANMSPYVQVKIDGDKKRTRADKGGGKKPTWNQEVPHSSKMRIKIYDQDTFVDDLVGVIDIPMKKYIQTPTQHAENIGLEYKGKPAGFLQATIRFSPNSSSSNWSSGANEGANSGWSIGQNNPPQQQQQQQNNSQGWNSGWGSNNNGWGNSNQGSKSGW